MNLLAMLDQKVFPIVLLVAERTIVGSDFKMAPNMIFAVPSASKLLVTVWASVSLGPGVGSDMDKIVAVVMALLAASVGLSHRELALVNPVIPTWHSAEGSGPLSVRRLTVNLQELEFDKLVYELHAFHHYYFALVKLLL